MKKKYEFSNCAFELTHVKDEPSLEIAEKTLVLNISNCEQLVNGYSIRPNKSIILMNCTIKDVKNLILSTFTVDYEENMSYPLFKDIESSWIRIYDYDKEKPETKVDLFRTEQITIENINLNFCFAKAGTNCGIHKEHGFMEFHTQVFGVGIMQKFYENSFDSLNLEEYMPPGYTHEAFHYADITYPWHQYYAVSDCVWFVAEIN